MKCGYVKPLYERRDIRDKIESPFLCCYWSLLFVVIRNDNECRRQIFAVLGTLRPRCFVHIASEIDDSYIVGFGSLLTLSSPVLLSNRRPAPHSHPKMLKDICQRLFVSSIFNIFCRWEPCRRSGKKYNNQKNCLCFFVTLKDSHLFSFVSTVRSRAIRDPSVWDPGGSRDQRGASDTVESRRARDSTL